MNFIGDIICVMENNYKNSIGICWCVNRKFLKNFFSDINKSFPIYKAKLIDVRNCLEEFVTDIYSQNTPKDYLKIKVDFLKKNQCRYIIVFYSNVDNPTFEYNEEEKSFQCLQIKKIKKELRNKYSCLLPNYYYDVLVHMTDNQNENIFTEKQLSKYDKLMRNLQVKSLLIKEEQKTKEGI